MLRPRVTNDFRVLYASGDSGARAPMAEVERWGLVRWPVQEINSLSFKPSVIRRATTDSGDALWTAHPQDGVRIGLAFSWVKVHPGVLLLKDPMGINSNALLMDEGGDLVGAGLLQAHLTWLVYQTAWQRDVERLLQ